MNRLNRLLRRRQPASLGPTGRRRQEPIDRGNIPRDSDQEETFSGTGPSVTTIATAALIGYMLSGDD